MLPGVRVKGERPEPAGERIGPGDVPAASVMKAAVVGVLALLCAGGFVSGIVGAFTDPGRQIIGLPVLALIAYGLAWLALREVRHAAWLDGTVLRVRGPFRVRACDLATARDLALRRSSLWTKHAGPVPALVAGKDDDGRSVRYPLVASTGRALSQEERSLLADAIDAGVLTLDSRAVSNELRKSEYLDIGTV